VIDTTISDPKTGEFLVVLQPGFNYAFNITKKGYMFYSENYNLSDTIRQLAVTREFLLSPIEKGINIVLENVFFDFDRADLKAESFTELDLLFGIMHDNPDLRIKIDGHTDNVGGYEYNMDLSQRRAKAVFNYLVSKGIEKDRIEFRGYGDSQPVATNETKEGRSANRRTEVTLLE
jgi:outer membrane protein OmpA-like peptidoglycan-associated protein